MAKRDWTESELNFIKDNCKVFPLDELAFLLARSRSSTNNKMRALGLYSNRLWSQDEIDFLTVNFNFLWVKDIAEYLNRPEPAIHHKAQRLGLSHGRWWTTEEISLLKSLYGHSHKKEIAFELGRSESSVACMAIKLGIAKKFGYPPERFCVDCGKKLVNKYMMPERCSSCAKKHRSGSDHPMWNGGVTKLYKLIQRSLWKFWKLPILKRDNFTCQECGYKGKALEVHHERRLVEIRDSILKSNQHLSIDIWEEKVELSRLIVEDHTLQDGVTLCGYCHKLRHTPKPGELLGSPNGNAEDNQQPSPPKLEVIVGGKVQRLTGEESATDNPDTSARHAYA